MVATGRRDAIACSTAARGGAILQILIFEQGTFERELMPEAFLSLIVTMLPAFRNVEQRLDRETGRRFNVFDNLFPMDERAMRSKCAIMNDNHPGSAAASSSRKATTSPVADAMPVLRPPETPLASPLGMTRTPGSASARR